MLLHDTTVANAPFPTAPPTTMRISLPEAVVEMTETAMALYVSEHAVAEPELNDHIEGIVNLIFSFAANEFVSGLIVRTKLTVAPAVVAEGTSVASVPPSAPVVIAGSDTLEM